MKRYGHLCKWTLALVLVAALMAAPGLVRPASALGYYQTFLVSDIPGLALRTDPNLVNPWGLVFAPGAGVFWVSDNGTGVSTLYAPNGAISPLVVTVPPSSPTGIALNNTSSFLITNGVVTQLAKFIWVTEAGTIAAWNPLVDPNAIIEVDNSLSGAVYKGVALATNKMGSFLYAANFNSGFVEIYDGGFGFVSQFTDPALADLGYAPFGIRTIGGLLYVTFAKQDEAKHDDQAGPGNGYIDVFDTTGKLIKRFASRGHLNSPWGLAFAPYNFGEFSNTLLVGNFGDGRISSYDLATGAFIGQLTRHGLGVVSIPGLWGLEFLQPQYPGGRASLYFTAGINHEADGVFGYLLPALF